MAAVQGWSKLYDDAPEHPKFLAVGHRAAWLYFCGQAYCSRQATDGLIPKQIVARLTDVPQPMRHASKLVEAGLWHDRGDHFEQHDYCEMQSTAAEREERRSAKRAAGTRGNHTRWHSDRGVVDPDCRWCESQPRPVSDRTTVAGAITNGSHRVSPEAEAEAEAEAEEETPPSTDVDNDEVEEQFEQLWAVWPKRNGKKIGKGDALRVWRRLTLPQRRDAYRGARNYAAACDDPRITGVGAQDCHRWLTKRRWDDWQQPAVPDGTAPPAPADRHDPTPWLEETR